MGARVLFKRLVCLAAGVSALGAVAVAAAAPHDVEVAGKGHRYIIWLVPTLSDGTKPPLTSDDITNYCSAAENFAQRMWKVTNGRHKIFQVQFSYGDAPMRYDGIWKREDAVAMGPAGTFKMFDTQVEAVHSWSEEALADGITQPTPNVQKTCKGGICVTATCPVGFTTQPVALSVNRERCVDANGHSPLESAQTNGFVLSHETGHSHYGLTDEYFLEDSTSVVYGFNICSDSDWHTSIMGTRSADFWCDPNTHLSSRGINGPFASGTMISSSRIATNGDQWTIAKTNWTDLLSYDPGPTFIKGPGITPQNEYFTAPVAAWAPLPTDQFCVFTGTEIASQTVNDVAVVVDKSGSMGYRVTSQDLTAFQHAFSAGLSQYNRTQPTRKSGLSVFDSTVTRTIPYGNTGGAFPLSSFDLTASGSTNLCAAISDTALQIRQGGSSDAAGHMVLLTDGRPTVAGCNTAEAVRKAAYDACFPADGGKPVTISTLAFGDADYAMLQQIADVCGGSARMVDGSGSGGMPPNPTPPAGGSPIPSGAAIPLSIQTAASRLAYRVRNYQELMFAQEQLPAVYERSFDVPAGASDIEFVWMAEKTIRVQDPDSHSGDACRFDQDYHFDIIDPNGNPTGFDVVNKTIESTYMTRTRTVSKPIAGRWTMRTTGGEPCVVGTDVAPPQVAMLAVYRNNKVSARLDLEKSVATSNDRIRATVSLEIAPNTLQTGLSIAAKLVNGATQLSMPMYDDGINGGDVTANDGIYTTTINPTCAAQSLTPGGYRFVAEISANQSTGHAVLSPDPDVQRARGGGAVATAQAISASLVEEKLLTIRGCNSAQNTCGGTTTTNLCPAEQTTLNGGGIKLAPGGTVHDVSVTVRNCPIASSGVKVGVGPGVTASNVRSSYDDASGTGTVTFDLTAAATARAGNLPLAIDWAGKRCATTGALIPICRETPLTLAPATIPVCGAGGANNVTLTPPDLTATCFQSPTVAGRVVTSNGVAVSPPRAVPSSGVISLVPGTHVVEWVITAAGGVTQTSRQTVFVLPGFAAAGSFSVADRARTLTSSGGYAAIASYGSGTTDIGVLSHTGDVLSVGNVLLRDRGTVHGFVTTSGALTRQNLTTVTGAITEHKALTLGGVSNPPMSFPVMMAGSDVIVPPDSTGTAAPGPHRQLTVFSRSKLTLQAGDYVLEGLDIEPQATLVLTPQTRLFVKTSVIYRGTFANAAGQLPDVYLAYYGTDPIVLESNFSGSLLAANARATLGDADSLTFSGRILAHDIALRPDVTLTCTGATTALNALSLPVEPPLQAEAEAEPVTRQASLTRHIQNATNDPGSVISTGPQDVSQSAGSCALSAGNRSSAFDWALASALLGLGLARRRKRRSN